MKKMRGIKFLLSVLAIGGAAFAIFLVLKSDKALLIHPKGVIAHQELKLMVKQIALMLIVIVPTFIVLYVVAWKYRAQKGRAQQEGTQGGWTQFLFWLIPSSVIAVMAFVTWEETHALDPFKPLKSDVKPLKIQVVALDWKWLFIYPEQGIAALNYVQFPENTPIHLELTADGSPMNSFWLPQLSGQIDAMSGMVTSLHLMGDTPGTYTGRAAEINGDGYASMTFIAQVDSQAAFEKWLGQVKQSPLQLTDASYAELLKPSLNDPISLYSSVEKEMLNKIVMKYMHPH